MISLGVGYSRRLSGYFELVCGETEMAVVQEGVGRWSRGYVELDHSHVNRKKRAWGEDAQRVMQLMMGQLRSEDDHEHVTLDLLGKASSGELKCNNGLNWGFLELDPDQPLPCGWEKCLDLKVGLTSRSFSQNAHQVVSGRTRS